MIQWSEQQQMIQKMVRDFVEKEIVPQLDDIEYNGVPPYDILRKLIKTFGMDVMAKQSFEKQRESHCRRGNRRGKEKRRPFCHGRRRGGHAHDPHY